mmetsp:Transcript_80818/g.218888  ORF Transcript_80818/g.218888 Transcript_80818/m.218888 type:complete len:532 (-) Transcript_80818:132-1727(-)
MSAPDATTLLGPAPEQRQAPAPEGAARGGAAPKWAGATRLSCAAAAAALVLVCCIVGFLLHQSLSAPKHADAAGNLRPRPLGGQNFSANFSAAGGNPFKGRSFYVNPVNSQEFEGSIQTATGTTRENLLRMQGVPSAYWIDVKAKVRGAGTRSLQGILADASARSPPELVVVIWYDLPNRDCDAKASSGEICCYRGADGACDYLQKGDCAEGLNEYKAQYADPFIEVLKEYESKLPIVVVLEPDSLPNLATNLDHPKCGNPATIAAYTGGIRYAMEQLTTQVPTVSVYLDAAHGGWMGWEDNLEKYVNYLKKAAFPMTKIRGFATNVANYQPLGQLCPFCPDQGWRNGFCLNGHHTTDPCCADPCKLLGQWSPGNNELNYAQDLVRAAKAILGMDARAIIDTGRNGVANMRKDCKNWCNPRGAGAGIPSTADVAHPEVVDAYYWLKTPGESDGCSQQLPDGSQCPRFDTGCGSPDSIGSLSAEPRAPEAGAWFDHQVKQLAANARFEAPAAVNRSAWGYAACGPGYQPPHR